jgi:hypothetical protein
MDCFFRDYEVYPKDVLTYIMRVSPIRQTEPEFADVGNEWEPTITFVKKSYHGYYLEVPTWLQNYYRRKGMWVPGEMYLQPDHNGVCCTYKREGGKHEV